MRRISSFTPDQIIDYNLRDGGTAVTFFADAQAYRVERARAFVKELIGRIDGRAVIWELGCSSGDIAGYFANDHDANGIDIVPAAVRATRERWPAMSVVEGKAEDLEPVPCDVLILTEFLEHIHDPDAVVANWLPLAQSVVIGHPLNDPGGIEPGHIWSYTYEDYLRWFTLGGHRMLETHLFSGPFPEMVLGYGTR